MPNANLSGKPHPYHTLLTTELDSEDDDLFEFYCPTCLLSFENHDQLKAHYKSHMHQYNTKRKMVGLPPVRPEEFETIKKSKPTSLTFSNCF